MLSFVSGLLVLSFRFSFSSSFSSSKRPSWVSIRFPGSSIGFSSFSEFPPSYSSSLWFGFINWRLERFSKLSSHCSFISSSLWVSISAFDDTWDWRESESWTTDLKSDGYLLGKANNQIF